MLEKLSTQEDGFYLWEPLEQEARGGRRSERTSINGRCVDVIAGAPGGILHQGDNGLAHCVMRSDLCNSHGGTGR
jgi:hypothetical protein